METFSALLAYCAWNSPVSGEFPAQMPVTRSFDVFFDLRLNKRLSKQSWGWWSDTPSSSLWRHRNGNGHFCCHLVVGSLMVHVMATNNNFVACHSRSEYSIWYLASVKTQLTLRIHYNDVIMSVMASQITSLTIVYSTVYSGTDQRKHQSSASLAFVRGLYHVSKWRCRSWWHNCLQS